MKPLASVSGELGDGVGARFGDVVARDGHGVVVANAVVDVVLLHVAHEFEREGRGEDAGVLRLVFLENVGLDRSAHRLQRAGLDLSVDVCVHHLVARRPTVAKPNPLCPSGEVALGPTARHPTISPAPCLVRPDSRFHLLVDGGVEEEGQQMMGAGPLMVIETEVLALHRSKPE